MDEQALEGEPERVLSHGEEKFAEIGHAFSFGPAALSTLRTCRRPLEIGYFQIVRESIDLEMTLA